MEGSAARDGSAVRKPVRFRQNGTESETRPVIHTPLAHTQHPPTGSREHKLFCVIFSLLNKVDFLMRGISQAERH